MAVPAKNPPSQQLPATPPEAVLNLVQLATAALFAKGYRITTVSKLMARHMYPNSHLEGEKLYKQARIKIRRWRKKPEFLDAIYEASLRQVEYDTPQILAAITKKAKKGQIKHAQWLLELTGRYTPKNAEQQAANVTVVFSQGLPRPQAALAKASVDEVDGEVVDEEEE